MIHFESLGRAPDMLECAHTGDANGAANSKATLICVQYAVLIESASLHAKR